MEKSEDKADVGYFAYPITAGSNTTTRQTMKEILHKKYESPTQQLFNVDVQHWSICQGKSYQVGEHPNLVKAPHSVESAQFQALIT